MSTTLGNLSWLQDKDERQEQVNFFIGLCNYYRNVPTVQALLQNSPTYCARSIQRRSSGQTNVRNIPEADSHSRDTSTEGPWCKQAIYSQILVWELC